jgi:hypothetical protein
VYKKRRVFTEGEKAAMRAKRQATRVANGTTFQAVGSLRKERSPNEKAASHAKSTKRLASHARNGTSIAPGEREVRPFCL